MCPCTVVSSRSKLSAPHWLRFDPVIDTVIDRKYVSQEVELETFTVPLDVQVEVLVGLALCIVGLLGIYTTNLLNIGGLHYYDCK